MPAAQAFESDEAPASAAAAPIKARLHDEEAPAASVVVSRDVEDLYVVHDEQDSFNLSTSADLAVRESVSAPEAAACAELPSGTPFFA